MKIIDGKDFIQTVSDELSNRLNLSKGLLSFISTKRKFEGWVKVEVIDIIRSKTSSDAIPEQDRIDIVIDGKIAVELKIVTTHYGKPVLRNTRKNLNNVVLDIKKLKKSKYREKLVLFIAFPIPVSNLNDWEHHLNELIKPFCNVQTFPFHFSNNSIGHLCIGVIY